MELIRNQEEEDKIPPLSLDHISDIRTKNLIHGQFKGNSGLVLNNWQSLADKGLVWILGKKWDLDAAV